MDQLPGSGAKMTKLLTVAVAMGPHCEANHKENGFRKTEAFTKEALEGTGDDREVLSGNGNQYLLLLN